MNRGHKWLLLASLAGAVALVAGLCWAQPRNQSQAQKKVVEQQKQDETPYTEEEYSAYDAATKEPDLAKRAVLLIAFMDKYPKSVLQVYIVNAYESLMAQYYEKHDYKTLEPLAEQWLKYKPDDLKTLALLTESAQKLGHDAKVLEYGQKVYAAAPSAQLASVIYQTYEKMGDQAKREEWALKLMAMPEFNDNFELRMLFVVKYAEKKDFLKAADYAQQALKALALAKKPDAMSQADWVKRTKDVEHACYDIIGNNYDQQRKWDEAIQAFERALKVKLYDGGYYHIGYAQWQQGDVDSAILSFAKAEYLDGEFKAQATKHFEALYKSQHNQTLTGSEKVRNRARMEIDALRIKK
jgi:tetratricopeptide (TPR) repeat protein